MSEEENTEEDMEENVEEKAQDFVLEDFRAFFEYITRSFTRVRLPVSGLTDDIRSTLLSAANDNEHANYEIAYYLGGIDKLLAVLHTVDFNENAKGFFTNVENVKRFMFIMSNLAKLYFDIQTGTESDKSIIITKLDMVADSLKAYITDLIGYLDKRR
jgi:hypothetical protein